MISSEMFWCLNKPFDEAFQTSFHTTKNQIHFELNVTDVICWHLYQILSYLKFDTYAYQKKMEFDNKKTKYEKPRKNPLQLYRSNDKRFLSLFRSRRKLEPAKSLAKH